MTDKIAATESNILRICYLDFVPANLKEGAWRTSTRRTKMRLENKVAIVTGAATGIGQAIAVRFAQEGASVVIDFIGNLTRPIRRNRR